MCEPFRNGLNVFRVNAATPSNNVSTELDIFTGLRKVNIGREVEKLHPVLLWILDGDKPVRICRSERIGGARSGMRAHASRV